MHHTHTAAEFHQLADQWLRERQQGVDVATMIQHTAYQAIIDMGDDAVPFLLQRLQDKPDHWFPALNAITGQQPVRPENRGRLQAMAQDWLRWGRENRRLEDQPSPQPLDDFKIHRYGANSIRNVRCREDGCDWPPYRQNFNRNIAQAMEHIRHTGHRVWLEIVDSCEIMPASRPSLSPTLTQFTADKNLDPSVAQPYEPIADPQLQRQWQDRMADLTKDPDPARARRDANAIMAQIAQAAGMTQLAQTYEAIQETDD